MHTHKHTDWKVGQRHDAAQDQVFPCIYIVTHIHTHMHTHKHTH